MEEHENYGSTDTAAAAAAANKVASTETETGGTITKTKTATKTMTEALSMSVPSTPTMSKYGHPKSSSNPSSTNDDNKMSSSLLSSFDESWIDEEQQPPPPPLSTNTPYQYTDNDDGDGGENSTGGTGTATVFSSTISMTKNLIGAGVLSLSGGIAMFADTPTAIGIASIWCFVLGTIFGFFCLLIAQTCSLTNSKTYRECWEATSASAPTSSPSFLGTSPVVPSSLLHPLNDTVENSTAADIHDPHDTGRPGDYDHPERIQDRQGRGVMGFIVALVSALLPGQGNLSYATVLSQTLQSLLETFGIHWHRVTCLLLLTIVALLPLCLMKSLDALAPFSTLGVVSMAIVMISLVTRSIDGSYKEGGQYFDDIDPIYQPSFGTTSNAFSIQILPYVCMLFQSFVMHYNSPRFYTELKHPTIPKYSQVVGYSFGLASTFSIVIAAAGFLTFGENSSSFILNNYSPHDKLAFISRVGIFISTLLIYPLAFVGVRDGLFDVLLVAPYLRTDRKYVTQFSIYLLSILTIGAIMFHDLGLINAVGGGALATFLCFVFPALMYRRAVLMTTYPATSLYVYRIRESWLALALMVVGAFLGILGVYQSIVEA